MKKNRGTGEGLSIREVNELARDMERTGRATMGVDNTRRGPGTGIVPAYNASGEAAPRRGICELSDTADPEDDDHSDQQVEFVKPGDSDGVGQYGILLEPIPDGKMGQIAISGGQWPLEVDDDYVPGDTVGPEDGSWIGTDAEAFEVLRGTIDDECLVRFIGGGGGGGLLLEAQEDMTQDYDDTDDTTRDSTTYEAKPVLSDGTLGSAIDVIRPPGVEIRSGQRGVLSVSDDDMDVFQLGSNYIEIRSESPDDWVKGRMWWRD